MYVINFDRGSKRQLGQIRWTLRERASAVLLILLLIALVMFVVFSQVSREHPFSWDAVKIIRSNSR